MNWLEKTYETARYLESDDGRWRISKAHTMGGEPRYSVWDRSDGYSRLVGTFKTLEEAKEKAE